MTETKTYSRTSRDIHADRPPAFTVSEQSASVTAFTWLARLIAVLGLSRALPSALDDDLPRSGAARLVRSSAPKARRVLALELSGVEIDANTWDLSTEEISLIESHAGDIRALSDLIAPWAFEEASEAQKRLDRVWPEVLAARQRGELYRAAELKACAWLGLDPPPASRS